MTLDSGPRSRQAVAWAAALAIAATCVVGCTRRHTVDCDDTGAPRYDRLNVLYELREGRGVLSSSAVQPVAFVTTETGDTQLVDEHRWSRAELAVEYPHAAARRGYARATLRLTPAETAAEGGAVVAPADAVADAPDRTSAAPEIWVLDLPREQLDLLIVDLARSGFFESQTRPVGGARLAVRLDGGEEAKAWDPDPRLDDLAERVYTEGWIQAFATPEPSGRPWWSFR